MRHGLPVLACVGGIAALACVGGIAAFASCGLSLVLLGLGLPYIVCAAISGLCAGLLIYALGHWSTSRQPPAPTPAVLIPDPAATRLAELEREMSGLRHELRGALSPALMVSDRLLKNEDPLVRRAGDAVVRSIERATALIGNDKPREAAGSP